MPNKLQKKQNNFKINERFPEKNKMYYKNNTK